MPTAGTVLAKPTAVNRVATVQTPFGGHQQSSHGRETGIAVIDHFSHVKTVTVQY
ncbi:aldehyde dehydrogenase family protein [Marinovum sp.]|uniref:aldehyde dehydrogenase family protein n=1 Tax=Marinovum sp. TaxID=2024839 RepID=UPI003A8F5D7A